MSKSQRIRDIFNNLIEAQSSQSKAWGQEMAKGIAKQRDGAKKEIASSEELVKQGIMPPIHTDIVKKNKKESADQLKRSARRVGREILGKQNDSINYARAGLRALFETVLDEAKEEGNLQRHPVNKPGDQALHNTLRAHFDSQDPEQAKYLHDKYDNHIKNVHKHRGTDNEATAHANLRGFEHEMLRHAAKTGSQGVTNEDVKQHRSMLKAGDANDKAGHKEINTRFYSPKQPDPNPDPA